MNHYAIDSNRVKRARREQQCGVGPAFCIRCHGPIVPRETMDLGIHRACRVCGAIDYIETPLSEKDRSTWEDRTNTRRKAKKQIERVHDQTPETLARTLRSTKGNANMAAALIGCHKNMIHMYVRLYPECAAAWEEAKAEALALRVKRGCG